MTRVLALHVANLSSISGIPYIQSWVLPGVILNAEPEVTPEHGQLWSTNKQTNKPPK